MTFITLPAKTVYSTEYLSGKTVVYWFPFYYSVMQGRTGKILKSVFFFLPGGHPAGLDRFVGCIDLTYLRDSLTNIRIRVLSPGRPSLGRMPHSPYYFFRGGVHISLFCPPSTCVCMCAVNAGGCVIDLFVQGWASTSSLLCLVTGNSANTDNSPAPTSPFCIPPYQAWRVAGGRWKITSDTLTLFRRTAPTGNRIKQLRLITLFYVD